MSYQSSPNFAFLAKYDARLVAAPTSAEKAMSIEDAVGALVHLRRFGEHLAQHAAAELGVYASGDIDQIERLRALKRRGVDEQTLEIFHTVRRAGNAAVHDGLGSLSTAFHHLKLCRNLAIWFHRTRSPGFKPGPFIPPARLVGDTEELRKEIKDLIAEAEAREEERDEAQSAVQAEIARRLGAEAAAKKAQEEAEFFEAYAAEQEALQAKNQVELKAVRAKLAALETAADQAVAQRQAEAEKSAPADIEKVLRRSNKAAAKTHLDEKETRVLIDQHLSDAGWEADSVELRYANGTRPQKGTNMAIAEWPTASGPADYVLFIGLTAVGAIEAKRLRQDVCAALGQSKRYSQDIQASPDFQFPDGGPWDKHKLPFLFAANGRPYLDQLREKSGIWHRDARRPNNLAKPLHGWPTPDGLQKKLRQDIDAANAKLDQEPTDYLGLRDYQVAAIKAVEEAIASEQDKLLVAMATGTGKTRTAIGLVYRLLKANRFRRVLFLVDRSALGEQTENAFDEVDIENLQTFGQIFGIEGLESTRPENATRLHISTVQGMVRRIFDDANPATAPKVDDYDCVIVDECHRGYGLDQELSDAEMNLTEYGIRSQHDYISKYRRVLEHFDAVKIGLTATPAKHTAEIFGRPVFWYSYREAVIDDYLIDHEPPINIVTQLAESGIHFDKGEQVSLFDPDTATVDLVELEDEVDLEVESFNKKVVAENFNRVVCRELAQHIDPDLPEKTLIFAATDLHADQVVRLLKEAFEAEYGEVDDDMVVKITGKADKPLQLIRYFKNEPNPKVVVTVDLLTTGIDVPKICNLVFLRRVRSRILYDQMIGRATRRCDAIGKETFKIYDAVGLYAALQDVTEMKPVVTAPNIGFRQLIEELEAVDDEAAKQHVLDQIIAKLQRKKRHIKGEVLEMFEGLAGTSPGELAKQLRRQSPAQAAEFFRNNPFLTQVLEMAGAGKPLLVSSAHDEVIRVERGYGNGQRPEDFLDAFSRFVKDNMNAMPALTVVAQRPRDLTRKQLKELELELSTRGYTETTLRSAWNEARNEDIAASVVGFIRQAALGDPLKNYGERVDAAVQKLKGKHPFTGPQKKWLDRIAKQLKKETVVDREALDRGQFSSDGGFERLNKRFDGRLDAYLGDLREYIWEAASEA